MKNGGREESSNMYILIKSVSGAEFFIIIKKSGVLIIDFIFPLFFYQNFSFILKNGIFQKKKGISRELRGNRI